MSGAFTRERESLFWDLVHHCSGHLNQSFFLLLKQPKLFCLPVLPIQEFLPPEVHTRKPPACRLAFLSSSPLGAATGWVWGAPPQTVTFCKAPQHTVVGRIFIPSPLIPHLGTKKNQNLPSLLTRGGGPGLVEQGLGGGPQLPRPPFPVWLPRESSIGLC